VVDRIQGKCPEIPVAAGRFLAVDCFCGIASAALWGLSCRMKRVGGNQPRADAAEIVAAVALGSNLGDRLALIGEARRRVGTLAGVREIAFSRIHETAPVGGVSQGAYLNAAMLVRTTRGAEELMRELLAIEAGMGRDRSREQRWGPRLIDLDLLLYGTAAMDVPGLTLPHPRMYERGFVLVPLSEIGGELQISGRGVTVAGALAALPPEARSTNVVA
jgi:2-amino-4-hydroxy-6-hydroxymethyldihydropteridine diphosphokinase